MRVLARDGASRETPLFGTTDREGFLAIGLEPGQIVHALAFKKPEIGFAYYGEEEVPELASGDVDLGTVVLGAGRALRGRCVHPDGTPARLLQLQARMVEPAPEGGFRPAPDIERHEFRAGLPSNLVSTDLLGRFALMGMRPGTFQVLAATDGREPTLLSDGAAWSSGGPEIEIVVPGRRLAIEVVGPDGLALEEARVAVTRLDAGGEPVGFPDRRQTTGSAPPLAMIDVEQGETLAVLASMPGCAAAEERIEIPDAPHETTLRLELVPERRHATLALRPDAGVGADWRVDLCAPLSGTPIPGFQDLEPDPGGRVHGLPLGRWSVRVEPRSDRDPAVVPPGCVAGTSAPITLGAGEAPLDFVVLRAARLRIHFAGASASTGAIDPHPAGSGPAASMRIDTEKLESAGGRWDWMAGVLMPARGSLDLTLIARRRATPPALLRSEPARGTAPGPRRSRRARPVETPARPQRARRARALAGAR